MINSLFTKHKQNGTLNRASIKPVTQFKVRMLHLCSVSLPSVKGSNIKWGFFSYCHHAVTKPGSRSVKATLLTLRDRRVTFLTLTFLFLRWAWTQNSTDCGVQVLCAFPSRIASQLSSVSPPIYNISDHTYTNLSNFRCVLRQKLKFFLERSTGICSSEM